ncbi:MAG: hypothetical protein JNM18_15975 [Planctomycetaceae bacterium]|nr:hypothetical protein [Planctomycetaceae bacterium]
MTNSSLLSRLAQIDDGELTSVPHAEPFAVVFPTQEHSPVVYTTKVHAAERLLLPPSGQASVGMIARYGFPDPGQIAALSTIVGERNLFFLGDCDPFDLLVYAWLQQHREICYWGISDDVLSAVGLPLNESMLIDLAAAEQNAMTLVADVLPSFAEIVGPNCAKLLASNKKIELEALASFRTRPQSDLLEMLK